MIQRVVIIGNGVAGITAARHVRKLSDHEITVISAESEYFFSRTALMYIYMGHMTFDHTKPYEDWFWKKNRIELVQDYVEDVVVEKKQVRLAGGNTVNYDSLVIASGSSYNVFDWPGKDLAGVQGLYSIQDLERMEQNTKGIEKAVIVGGGLIGVEMAEMLQSRDIAVTMLARETHFWDNALPRREAILVGNHIRSHHVDLRLSTELKEIVGDNTGKVTAVITDKGEKIDCQFVGLTAGVHPNITFLKESAVETKRGVLVDQYLKTNIPDVYAIGDCVEHRSPPPGRNPIEQVWYTGRQMGEAVAHTICGNLTRYSPGFWFNSAKFFNLEYQTYGKVSNQLEEGEEEYYWEHTDHKKCMHLVFARADNKFLGINVLGIRMRHQVFDRWLREERDIYHVVKHLEEANFDPEFFTRHEREIREGFYRDFPEDGKGKE
ncbi:MAG: FAD-dependent oxidoreductase [Cyclobacteriaceae bacterium]|nr:FAD-dependent oxidoreductase [Cyclobacteriaceae bacterium]